MANQLYKGDKPLATFIPKIADNLTTDDSTKALSAKQGKVLNDKIGEVIGLTGNSAYFSGSSFPYVYYQKIGNVVVGGARIVLTATKPAGQENYLFNNLPIPSGAIVPVVVSLGDTASLLINANGVLTSNDSVTGAHNISFCYICQ